MINFYFFSQTQPPDLGFDARLFGRQRCPRLPLPLQTFQGIVLTSVCLVGMPAFSQSLPSQTSAPFPTRPIRLIVPSTPGGSVDTLARVIGSGLAEKFHQPAIIDNRAGAGGVIGAEITTKAPSDGYTLMLGTVAGLAANVSLKKSLPYHPLIDFAPITLVASQNLILVIYPGLPVKNIKELIALGKNNPQQLSFASAGNGVGGHLSGELFKLLTGMPMLHIPYKGISPALMDVIGGQVSLSFASISTSLPLLQSAKLKGLAVTSAKRSLATPETPTLQEAGVAGYESSTWYGLVAPRATSAAIITVLNEAVVKLLNQPSLRQHLASEGAEPVGNSASEFALHLKNEIAKWAKVIKAAGLKAD